MVDLQANPIVIVQCVCGRLKQRGFICDFCYSAVYVTHLVDPGKQAVDAMFTEDRNR